MAGAAALSRLRARTLAAIFLFALLAGLGAALWWQRAAEPAITARPALWRISAGDRHAWLFGTIHAVPAGAHWLDPKIREAARDSDWLVLEVTGLDQERRDRHVFETLGRSPGLPSVAARLAPADRPRLAALERKAPAELHGLDGYESWAAALLISAAASSDIGLSNAEAGEARFEAMFAADHRPVLGLETVSGQLGLFDALPESDQRALLAQAVREAQDAPRLYGELYRIWARADLNSLERQFLAPLNDSPHLKDVLVDRRNARWAREIDHLLRHNDRVLFIAVGAGHLLGPASLQARLAALGWTVRRVR